MSTIQQVSGLEILDSRGNPTIKATCVLDSGTIGQASVPSGASTGTAEAHELRDGDATRYQGKGCRTAVHLINTELNQALSSRAFATQQDLDETLLSLDGTDHKSRLGGNTILALSLAFARAQAHERDVPLYDHFSSLVGTSPRLPRPTINLFSGGKHAGGQVPIQDVLIVPVAASTMDEALSTSVAVYQAAARLCEKQYGMRLLTADEGGLAPPFPDVETMFRNAVQAIEQAGYRPGEDVALAIDVASSHFFQEGAYHMGPNQLSSAEMADTLASWVARYPIISVEDGLAEDDWEAWPHLLNRLHPNAITLGDDLLCTNPARIQKAIATHAANALLLKVNQIGTLTEAAVAYRQARAADWTVVVSARSGETEDDWLADLAVGWAGDNIKVGSITQSERLAKYNRLLAIEATSTLVMA